MPGYTLYAATSRSASGTALESGAINTLDVLLWCIVSGHGADMFAAIWRRCDDPIRCALLGSACCASIIKQRPLKIANTQLRARLNQIQLECSGAIVGLLNNVRRS